MPAARLVPNRRRLGGAHEVLTIGKMRECSQPKG
jgi:hypothetical protein